MDYFFLKFWEIICAISQPSANLSKHWIDVKANFIVINSCFTFLFLSSSLYLFFYFAYVATVFFLQFTGNTEAATRDVFKKKVFIKNFTKFTVKLLYRSLFFNKVAGPMSAAILKKKLRDGFGMGGN